MLTTKQKQLLKRAVLYPSMVITEMFVCFLLPFLWLLLIMIDDLVLQGQELFTVGFYAMPVLVFILLIILMVQGLYIQRATRKEDWMEMVKMAKGKLEDPETNMLLEKAANVGFLAASLMTPEGFYAGARMAAEARLLKRMKAIRNTAIQMCILFREKVPNRIPYMLALIFVPVIILVGLYGFRYIDTIQTNRADAQRTADVVYHIEDVLDTTCADTYIQDPLAKFDRIGYTITADLYDEVETERAEETEASYRCLLRGMDADGAALVSELYLYAPFVSARYYLLFQATDAVYDESRKMIDDVIASFALTMTREEVYAHMREMREDAANASAQEDAETATDMESEAEGAGTGTEGGGQ